ncbi:hypothetical protein [Actinoplanes flavus]|uniref:Lipoprotein n=1 Tax=Actinoplanes flavus TaxID=2820290 RepID=A0ABS3UYH1_9ACTN|nr:hypothetical protein [Actinoplanes flavus]MBO3743604.1 hypothetical protein [Actinoplanes flavus]
MKKTTLQAGAAALAAAAMLLAGCGSSDSSDTASTGAPAATQAADNGVAALTADEILAKAKEALKKAGSYHVKGSATQDGTEMAMDFRVSGVNFAGTLSMGQGDVELLLVDGKQYMRPSEGFYTMLGMGETAKTVTAALGTKWLEVSATDKSMSSIFGIVNIDEMLSSTGTAAKGEPAQLDGRPVITLTDSDDATSKLFVATTGEPYPLRMGEATGDGITFTEFGDTFADIKAPAADQVLDMAALTGKK